MTLPSSHRFPFWLAAFAAALVFAFDGPPLTRAESSGYEETSRYLDVIAFITRLQARSENLRLESFGRSHEGRDLPLMILADPPIMTPRAAADSGKPILFIMANIHGGEVEGKEAALHFARRMLIADLRPVLKRVIVLIAPIYNADGNERINSANRPAQYGPIGGVGIRENANGLDLNRDYMKAEAGETRALLRLFLRWDPHITVDLHTTNGSHHGYHLTYSIPLNPTIDRRILSYHRDRLMPAIQKAVRSRHGFRTYYYGNFSGPAPESGGADRRTWRAFIPQPRAGQNYVGFRNRLTILTEAYSYLDFRSRIAVTEAMLEEIAAYAAARGEEIRKLTRKADEDMGKGDAPLPIGLEYELRPLPTPVEILVGEVRKVANARTGRDMTAAVEGKVTSVNMLDYGVYSATRSVPAAHAYVIPAESGLNGVVSKLLDHGIVVEELTADVAAEVESFIIGQVDRAGRPLQGHRTVTLKGDFRNGEATFPAGSLVVRTAQPLGRLAAYLLEPESDDGLVYWNFMDEYLGVGKAYPIRKLTAPRNLPARIVTRDTTTTQVRPIVLNPPLKELPSHEE